MRWIFTVLIILLGGCPALEQKTTVNCALGVPRFATTGEAAIETTVRKSTVNRAGQVVDDSVRRELVYAGHDGTTIFVLYLEYSGGLIRDGFRQELVYDLVESKQIAFGPWQIDVGEFTNLGITLTVVTDHGLAVEASQPIPNPSTKKKTPGPSYRPH